MDPEAHRGVVVAAVVRRQLRSTVIDVAPVFGFTVGFAVTHRLVVALAMVIAAGAGVCVYRVVRVEPARRTLAALCLVCYGGVLAASTRHATDFFLPSLLLHCVTAVVTLALLLLGRPPMGLLAELITSEKTRGCHCAVRCRAFTRGNLVILTGHLAMAAVQLPLFVAGQTVALGSVDVFGPIVLALGALLGRRVYRRAVGTHRCVTDDHPSAEISTCLERTSLS